MSKFERVVNSEARNITLCLGWKGSIREKLFGDNYPLKGKPCYGSFGLRGVLNLCTYLSNSSARYITAVRVIVKRAYAYAYTVRYSIGETRLSVVLMASDKVEEY